MNDLKIWMCIKCGWIYSDKKKMISGNDGFCVHCQEYHVLVPCVLKEKEL